MGSQPQAGLDRLLWRVSLLLSVLLAVGLAAFGAALALLPWPARRLGPAQLGLLAALVVALPALFAVASHALLSRLVGARVARLFERLREAVQRAGGSAGAAAPEHGELDELHRHLDAMIAEVRRTHEREIEAERALHTAGEDGRRRHEFEETSSQLSERIAELDRANEQINRLALQLEEKNGSLERAVKNIAALNRVGVALASELDLDRLVSLVVNISVKGLRVEVGEIYLLDEERARLVLRGSSGLPAGAQAAVALEDPGSVSAAVARGGQPLLLRSFEDGGAFRRESRWGHVRRTALCVPIRMKDRVLGTIELTNRRGGDRFGEEDLEMLRSIANQAAVAIENANLYQEVQRGYLETIRALVQTVEEKDRYTRGHSERVTRFSVKIAGAMGLPPAEVRMLQYAGVLHDIGKIGIDLSIIHKRGRLSPEEYTEIKNHPLIGERIIRPIGFLAGALAAVAQHHERYDGCGYPLGLTGEEMTLEARILAVADAYDAMITERPYRKPLARQAAIAELRRCSGSQFDPAVVEHFVEILDNDLEIRQMELEIAAVGT